MKVQQAVLIYDSPSDYLNVDMVVFPAVVTCKTVIPSIDAVREQFLELLSLLICNSTV